jgi:large subunit ribosomal protein L25
MDTPTITLSPRTIIGKKVKQLRREGVVPVHVYGWDIDAMSLQVEVQTINKVLPAVGSNIPLTVEIDGRKGESVCFVREVQRHPVTDAVLHVDFLSVNVSQTIRAEVPIVLVGNAPAVRDEGGTLLQPLQAVLVEALPMNVPASVEADVSDLDDFEKGVYLRDLTLDANVTVITDLDEMIARVAPPRVEEEPVVEEELEEGLEGEEGAEEGEEGEEGEAPADGAASTEGQAQSWSGSRGRGSGREAQP